MNITKIISAAALAFALIASPVFAESCCDKAKAENKDCAHKCCVEATKEGKVCTKCNPDKAEKAEKK